MEKRSVLQEQSDGENGRKRKFLEVIYVADQYAIEVYGLIDLPEMLMAIGNIVRMFFFF